MRLALHGNDPSSNMRLALWTANWRAFLAHPLIGVGRAINSGKMYLDMIPEKISALNTTTAWAHNIYLDLLSSVGLAGFLAVLFYWWALPFTLIIRSWRRDRLQSRHGAILLALSLSYASWFIGAFFENSFDVNHNRILLSVLFAGFFVLTPALKK